MKKKSIGKKISFRGQWQNKTKSKEKIYLFIYKNEVAILRVELLTQHFHNKI